VASQAPVAPPSSARQVVAEDGAFSLLLTHEGFNGHGSADYDLAIGSKDGAVEVTVRVDAQALTATELELRYPADRLKLLDGEFEDWPGDAGEVKWRVDTAKPGQVKVEAQLLADAGQGASGQFALLRVRFMAAAAS